MPIVIDFFRFCTFEGNIRVMVHLINIIIKIEEVNENDGGSLWTI
jgi:hypothetical protein